MSAEVVFLAFSIDFWGSQYSLHHPLRYCSSNFPEQSISIQLKEQFNLYKLRSCFMKLRLFKLGKILLVVGSMYVSFSCEFSSDLVLQKKQYATKTSLINKRKKLTSLHFGETTLINSH